MTISITTGKGNARRWRDRGPADWLALAASPTFAAMAWFAASDAPRMPLCAPASGPLPIGGMAWMYALMCLFHVAPWLKLLPGRIRPVDHPVPLDEGDRS